MTDTPTDALARVRAQHRPFASRGQQFCLECGDTFSVEPWPCPATALADDYERLRRELAEHHAATGRVNISLRHYVERIDRLCDEVEHYRAHYHTVTSERDALHARLEAAEGLIAALRKRDLRRDPDDVEPPI